MSLYPLESGKLRRSLVADIAGWYGMTAIVSAYLLVSFGVIQSHSYVFQLLNLTGSIGMMIISLRKRVRQAILLNGFWMAIALVALWQILATH